MGVPGRMRAVLVEIPAPSRTAAAGLFAWTVCVLLPVVHRAGNVPESALLLLPLAPLLLGAGLWLARARSRAAPYVLLTAFPIAIALCLSRFPHDVGLATFSPFPLICAMMSLAAYGAAAIALCSQPAAVRAVEHRPLGEVPPIDPETRRKNFGALVVAVVTLGSLWVTFSASWGTPARLREHWGRAAPEGATLSALGAGLTGALALAIVAPALRAERGPRQPPDERRRKLTWVILVAMSGGLVYGLLRLSGR